MELSVNVEKTSPIQRKLTIKVPAQMVNKRWEQGLAEVQKTAKIKGFRPGNVPITIIRQYYGSDVRHQVFHNLIDESYKQALRDQQIRAVGSPQIETPDHQTGQGSHDHSIKDGQDLTFTATVEVLPEIEVKGYTGLSLTRKKTDITDGEVDGVVRNIQDSQAQLIPLASPRAARKSDHADINFTGGLVTETGIEEKEGMKGQRVLEIGSDTLIPGFEENLVGMQAGETKTFRVPFPADFYESSMAGKDAEFTVTLNEIKEKQLPELSEEFAKTAGYESVADLRAKAKTHLTTQKADESERQLRSDLLQQLIEKNPFDVPASLVQAQTRSLAQDVAGNLKNQGFNDQMIQEALTGELEQLKKRAESQVRASLLLEAIAKAEGIAIKPEEIDEELKTMAVSAKVEEERIRDYYLKNQQRKDDLEFRMREDRTVKFILGKGKVKDEK